MNMQRLEASERDKGYGTKMLNLLCNDKYNVKIYLDAAPYNTGMGLGALLAFYRKAGFRPFPEMANFAENPMLRLPNSRVAGAAKDDE